MITDPSRFSDDRLNFGVAVRTELAPVCVVEDSVYRSQQLLQGPAASVPRVEVRIGNGGRFGKVRDANRSAAIPVVH